jgi:hypothetical protein
MRKIILKLSLLFLIPVITKGQILDTFDYRNDGVGISTSPVYEISRINKIIANFIGLKISLVSEIGELGFSLEKLNSNITYDVDILNSHLKIINWGGDIFYKKYYRISNNMFFSVGSSIGVSFAKLKYVGSPYSQPFFLNEIFASDTYFFVKPQFGIDYNIWKEFYISLNTGYKITGGLKMDFLVHPEIINYTNKDFNDFFVNFSIKYIFLIK